MLELKDDVTVLLPAIHSGGNRMLCEEAARPLGSRSPLMHYLMVVPKKDLWAVQPHLTEPAPRAQPAPQPITPHTFTPHIHATPSHPWPSGGPGVRQ